MFNKEYQFKGKHAEIVALLTSELDTKTKFKLFERNIDAFILAPIVGFMYGRRSQVDNSGQVKLDSIKKINFQQLNNESDTLNFYYRLVMLLHDKDKIDIEERLNRAFKYDSKSEEGKNCFDIFDSYILGGIDVMKEKLLDNATTPDDYINNLYKFIEEYNTRYNDKISEEEILELCKKAGDN